MSGVCEEGRWILWGVKMRRWEVAGRGGLEEERSGAEQRSADVAETT